MWPGFTNSETRYGAAALVLGAIGVLTMHMSGGVLSIALPAATGALVAVLVFRKIRRLSSSLARARDRARDAEIEAVRERAATIRLRDATDSISDGFLLWDADDRLVLYNRRAAAGRIPKAEIGTAFDDYVMSLYPFVDVPGLDAEQWLKLRRSWFEAGDRAHEFQTKDGNTFLVTERRTDDGGAVTTYANISELKRAESARKQSEERLTHAQALARVGIFEWDAVDAEMYWSDILFEIVGMSAGSAPLEFNQYILLVHPAHRDLVRSTFRRLLTAGGQYNQEYEIVRPDGETRSVRAEAEAVTDDDGQIIRILGAVHDQTDIKRAERALRRAKEEAVRANQAKSEFLANVSHELRTPLNAVIGFSEVMLQEIFGPLGNARYREYANDIRQSGAHLLNVINDLLDYSKLEAGRLELQAEPVRVGAIIEQCVRMMHERAAAENVTLVNQTPEFDHTIEADERKVIQILLNLISNAIKFTPDAGMVSVLAERAENGVDIRVADSGIGMSENDIATALSPFGQVNSSLNREHTGTGLGLPLSRSLTELHRGTLQIESAPGKGTTVIVHLRDTLSAADAANPLRLVSGGQDG